MGVTSPSSTRISCGASRAGRRASWSSSPRSARRQPAKARRRPPSGSAMPSRGSGRGLRSAFASPPWAPASGRRAGQRGAAARRSRPWSASTCTSRGTSTRSRAHTTCSPPRSTITSTGATRWGLTPGGSPGGARSTSTTERCAPSSPPSAAWRTAFLARTASTSRSPPKSWPCSASRAMATTSNGGSAASSWVGPGRTRP